jgi:hypothetical protein
MTKRNLNKIPSTIIERIRTFDQDDVVVACAKLLRLNDIEKYSHLALTTDGAKLIVPPPRVPDPTAGRYSRANVEGYEKVRKDLPMISKEFGYDRPNWGDWSKGSHYVSRSRDVFQRDFYPPKEVELSIAVLEERDGGYLVKFAIDQVINRRTPNFEQELLYNLNLLQENVGAVDVFVSAASLAEYAASIRVDWQLLPPGSVDEVVQNMLKGRKPVSPEQERTMRDRVTVMKTLKPEAYITGTDGFLRYFGAKFGDDFVAFENVRYGNALYVMYEEWLELSKRSRVDLLSGPRDSFDRIEHRSGWEDKLKAAIGRYRDERPAKR